MLRKWWVKVSNLVKHLFAKKVTFVELSELFKRVEVLEEINKRKEAARQKRYNYKQTKK